MKTKLSTCVECGHRLMSRRDRCPNCGRRRAGNDRAVSPFLFAVPAPMLVAFALFAARFARTQVAATVGLGLAFILFIVLLVGVRPVSPSGLFVSTRKKPRRDSLLHELAIVKERSDRIRGARERFDRLMGTHSTVAGNRPVGSSSDNTEGVRLLLEEFETRFDGQRLLVELAQWKTNVAPLFAGSDDVRERSEQLTKEILRFRRDFRMLLEEKDQEKNPLYEPAAQDARDTLRIAEDYATAMLADEASSLAREYSPLIERHSGTPRGTLTAFRKDEGTSLAFDPESVKVTLRESIDRLSYEFDRVMAENSLRSEP